MFRSRRVPKLKPSLTCQTKICKPLCANLVLILLFQSAVDKNLLIHQCISGLEMTVHADWRSYAFSCLSQGTAQVRLKRHMTKSAHIMVYYGLTCLGPLTLKPHQCTHPRLLNLCKLNFIQYQQICKLYNLFWVAVYFVNKPFNKLFRKFTPVSWEITQVNNPKCASNHCSIIIISGCIVSDLNSIFF